MTLPIELIPGTEPPRFTWQQVIDGKMLYHSGMLQPSLESAVKNLVELAMKLVKENAELRGKLVVQSELLSAGNRNIPPAQDSTKPMNTSTGKRKG